MVKSFLKNKFDDGRRARFGFLKSSPVQGADEGDEERKLAGSNP